MRLELRLHLMAYNLGRALAYARRGIWGHFWAFRRLIGALYRHLRDAQPTFRDQIGLALTAGSFAWGRAAA